MPALKRYQLACYAPASPWLVLLACLGSVDHQEPREGGALCSAKRAEFRVTRRSMVVSSEHITMRRKSGMWHRHDAVLPPRPMRSRQRSQRSSESALPNSNQQSWRHSVGFSGLQL